MEKWKERLKKLDSEDKWEEETFNFIKEGKESNIFRLKDAIRNEFIQKRDLRNVCAHNKTRSIEDTSVEDLWDFIVCTKPFIEVNGTLEMLIQKFIKILRFTSKEEYNNSIANIVNDYSKLQQGGCGRFVGPTKRPTPDFFYSLMGSFLRVIA